MNKTGVKKIIKDTSRPVAETAKIVSVDIDRVSIQIGSSPNVIKNVAVMGAAEMMAPGMNVRIMWVDRRPVVVGGASSDVGTVVVSSGGGEGFTDLPIHSHIDNMSGGALASYITNVAHGQLTSHLLGVNVPHDDHGYLSGLGDDDHGQYVHSTLSRSITAQHVFAPPAPGAPFSLTSNAMSQTVAGFKADELNKAVTVSNGLTGGGALTTDLTIALGTPSTITESTANSASGTTHSHAVAASAAPGLAASLLKTTIAGFLTIENFVANNSLQVRGSTVARMIGPEANYAYDLGSLSYWWRKLYVNEMVGAVMSEYTQAVAGGWITVCKDQGTLAAGVTSGATTIDFGKSMAAYIGNIVLIRHLDASSVNKVEFVSITSLNSGTTYNVARDLAALNSPDPAWAIGTPYAVLGTTNDGFIELNAFDSPRFSIFKKSGTSWNAQNEIVRIGDLTGHPVAGASDVGMFIGDASQYLKYSAGVLTIAGNGAGLTQINGGNIQAGTVTAAKLSVTSLSAITANMGALTVDNTLTIGASGILSAGGGAVAIDVNGVSLYNKTAYDATAALKFYAGASSVLAGRIFTATGIGAGTTSDLTIISETATKGAGMFLTSSGAAGSNISLKSDDGATHQNTIQLVSGGVQNPSKGFIYINAHDEIDLTAPDVSISGRLNLTGVLYAASQINSSVATGTAPLVVASTTQVANLNSTYLDGLTVGTGSVWTVPYVDGNGSIVISGSKLVGSTAIGARALTSGTINISNALADNIISFAGTIFDDVPGGYSAHWAAGSPTRLTIRVAGVYVVSGTTGWPNNTTGTARFMGIKLNSSYFIGITSHGPLTTTATVPFQTVTATWKFAAGDYVELVLRQDSTANPLGISSTNYHSINFSIARIA